MPVLLARLALSPGRVVPARTLVEDLWDESSPDGGTDTLRRLVSRARSRLHEHGLTVGPVAHGGGYRLDVSPGEVDATAFERLAADGARLLREHAPEQAAEVLDEALALWRGSPLCGVEAAFARRAALHLEDVWLTVAEDRIDALSRIGDPSGLVTELRALCAAHPTRERCHGLLMRILHESGQSNAALAVHGDLRRTLAEELGTDPSPWIGTLHGEILRDRAPAPSRRWTNPYLTRFFGRQDELAAIGALMERTRLVTLHGPGGVGKTRLASEYASENVRHTRVCFVELASLRETDGLEEAVTATLGAGDALLGPSSRVRSTRLVSALSAVPTLLVLDNCEHVVDAAAELAVRLLSRCPDLHVLSTSREPLAAEGEALVRVGPLEVPEGHGGEAVAMFAELASLARPGFTVDADDSEVVTEICRRLDGLPLGIELAAARTRSMTVRQIARHLDERFRLLSGARRTGNVRHRTLRAVLDWTWNLLSDHERLLARRLSVLPGGATVDSARAVCDGSGVPADEIPFLLSSLTDKSLLTVTESPWGEPRHRLMETPRVYLEERLREVGEEGRVRDAAARHFADLAEDSLALLLGRDQPGGLALLDAEHDNLLESVRHACRDGDATQAVRTVSALSWYWIIRGRYEEARRWFDELDRRPEALTSTARAVSVAVRSVLPRAEGDDEPDTAPGCGPPPAVDADVLADHPPLAMITSKHRLLMGDHEGVRAEAGVALAHPHPWVRAAGLAASALADEAAGNAIGAERHTEAAVSAFRGLGDLWTTAQLVASLAGFQSSRGDVDGALTNLRRALELDRSLSVSGRFTPILIRLGGELVRAERFDEAERAFQDLWDTADAPLSEHRIMCLVGSADLALLRGRTSEARDLLVRARRLLHGPLADPDYLRAAILGGESALALATGSTEQALRKALRARETAESLGHAALRAETSELVADALWHTGDPDGAARALGTATWIRGRRDEGSPRVRSLTRTLVGVMGAEGFESRYAEGASGFEPLPR